LELLLKLSNLTISEERAGKIPALFFAAFLDKFLRTDSC